MTAGRLALVALFAVSGTRLASAADDLAIAIVVGSNKSDGSGQDPLLYADDDAIRAALLFRMMGTDTTILVTPDDETKSHFPSDRFTWLQNREAPTIANLRKVLKEAVR